MSLFQNIRDGHGPNFRPLLRSIWHLIGLVLVILLLLAALRSAHFEHDYARAAYEIALAILIVVSRTGSSGLGK